MIQICLYPCNSCVFLFFFSLSVVSTNLSAEKETGLRKCLAHKISRGAVYSGTGSIVTLNLRYVT